MSSDSDNDVGSVGESPAPESAVPKAEDDAVRTRRAFRSWSSAHSSESTPGVITRMRASLASLFARKGATPALPSHDASDAFYFPEEMQGADAVAPPDDFKLPWPRVDGDAPTVEKPMPSTEDLEIDAAFASVDEALPTHKPPPEPPRRPSLEIEVHQDRIAAAANALDSAGTLEFAPKADITLFGDTPTNLDMVDRAAELDIPTDEFEAVTEPVLESTDPLPALNRWSWLTRFFFWRKQAVAVAPAAATVVEGNPTFLFSKFRTFYNEIIRFKHQKTEFTAGFATALMSETSDTDAGPEAAAEALSKKLIEVLELQAAEAKWMGGEINQRYPDAQYAMAALADEIFANLEWEGLSAWADHLLEPRLYRTHGAEYELFKRMDKLLKDGTRTPVARDLARVYLLVLAAGFRGKYRRFGLTRALAEYRQRLYEFIYQDDALMLYAPDRLLFPNTTKRTMEGHAVSRFSAAQRWAAILAFLVVGYTLVAHFAWNRVSADLHDVTSRIVADSASRGDR